MRLILAIVLSLAFWVCQAQEKGQQKRWLDSILNQKVLSKREAKFTYQKYDFSKLYLGRNTVYGFIGENYSRLFMKFKTVVKDSQLPNVYYVTGQSRVRMNSVAFKGKIKISGIRVFNLMHWGTDDEYKNKGVKVEGLIFGTYNFSEDSRRSHSGQYNGITVSYFYIDKNNNVKYDDIEPSDSGNNNQFAGFWTSYTSRVRKICNWGDSRIPMSGDLDIGAGEFSVNPKYKKFGWQDFKY